MNILWIPHSSSAATKTRDKYFIEKLADLGHEIHSICWDVIPDARLSTRLNPRVHLDSLSRWRMQKDGITFHHLPRVHNYWHLFKKYGKVPRLNQLWFRNLVKEIVKVYNIDIVICSQNFDLIGFPPFDLKVPLIFDYLDCLDTKWEEIYVKNAQAVICASSVLFERARLWNQNCYYVPTGIEIGLFNNAAGQHIRDRLNLKGYKVLSLIGITAHHVFYWLEGIELAWKRNANLKCLFVGENSTLLPKIKKWAYNKKDRFIFINNVPYENIPEYFSASDIGIFPGHEGLLYDAACPIKVLEYTASGKPVIAPALEELKRWDFPNIVFVKESPESFAEGIEYALNTKFDYPDLRRFDINFTAEQLINILKRCIAAKKASSKWKSVI